jgi:hypothetical protein
MKKILNIFRRTPIDRGGADIKAAMIKAAYSGELFCDEVVNCIECEDASEEQVPAIICGLTRATASFLKSLEKSEINAKRLYDGMFDVWYNDVDDYAFFEKWVKELKERRLGLK